MPVGRGHIDIYKQLLEADPCGSRGNPQRRANCAWGRHSAEVSIVDIHGNTQKYGSSKQDRS